MNEDRDSHDAVSGISYALIDEGVSSIRMERERRGNAMSVLSVDATLRALAEADEVLSARVIVLYGEGPGFCAGSDIVELASMTHGERLDFEARCAELSVGIARYRVPVIAAVHGYALGGGLTLAASCDFVVATPDSRWGLPEVPIGLFPAWGLHAVEARCGRTVARQLAMGFEELDGTAASRIGLVDRIATEPFSAAVELARRIAKLPSAQLSAVKEYFSPRRDAEGADELANKLFARCLTSAEAVATFVRYGRRIPRTDETV